MSNNKIKHNSGMHYLHQRKNHPSTDQDALWPNDSKGSTEETIANTMNKAAEI